MSAVTSPASALSNQGGKRDRSESLLPALLRRVFG
jgi:hypothetical protein